MREGRERQMQILGGGNSSNLDGRREDVWAEEDHPINRFKKTHRMRRSRSEEDLRQWPMEAVAMSPQPCLLCSADFCHRDDLLKHIDEEHGGLQRYRKLMLESLAPHVVVGSEIRQYVANYATFLRHARMDWEGATNVEASLRCRLGCAFCARSFWQEELRELYLAGEKPFMQSQDGAFVGATICRALAAHPPW